jgi:hypothetical protein
VAAPEYGARNYGGAAVPTALSSDITGASPTMTVADGSSYPATRFFITIDPGLATEEKIYVATRTGNLFSGLERAEDDTGAQGHTAGAVIVHGWTAQDAREANAMSSVLTGRGGLITRSTATGPQELVAGTDGLPLVPDQTTALGLKYAPLKLTVGLAPFVNGKGALLAGGTAGAPTEVAAGLVNQALVADPAQPTGMAWKDVGLSQWTDWAPVVSQGPAVAATVQRARSYRSGKLLIAHFRLNVTGTGTSANGIVVSLPATVNDIEDVGGTIQVFDASAATNHLGMITGATTTTFIGIEAGGTIGTGPLAFGLANGDAIRGTLNIETI